MGVISTRVAGWASLVANAGLVVTGGAVRLTGSGLGCPTWPRCNGRSFTPHGAMDIHSFIEFTNRLLTFVLVAVAIYTVVAAWRSGRRDLKVVSIVIALGIPLQAVVGGVAVLSDLNPWVVSFHLLASMAIVGASVLFLFRLDHPAEPGRPRRRGPVAALAWATFGVAWAVLYAGTVVTGAGPHAGDVEAPRNGLSTVETSQLHADLVFLLIGLSLGLVVVLAATHAPPAVRRVAVVLLGVELAQGAIGYVQYFTGVPELLVGFHMLGAALISATVTWTLLAVVERPDTPTA